jgi:hypothetical protein
MCLDSLKFMQAEPGLIIRGLKSIPFVIMGGRNKGVAVVDDFAQRRRDNP